MSIIVNTESLIKSRHFIAASWKLIWENKKTFFALAALPIFCNALAEFFELYSMFPILNTAYGKIDLISTISSFTEFFIASTFASIAWTRFLLDPAYTPTVKSYLTLDKKFFKYLLYTLLVGLLYVISIFAFLLLMKVASAYLNTVAVVSIAIVGALIILYFLLPASLVFPAIALDKPAGLFKTIGQASPYRTSFFLGIILLCLTIALTTLAFEKLSPLFTIPALKIATIAINSILGYVFSGLLWSFAILYYKKHFMTQAFVEQPLMGQE